MSMPMVERAIFSVPLLVLRAKVLGYPFRPKEKTGAIPLWLGPSHGQHDIDPSPAADERADAPLPAVPFGPNGGKGHKTSTTRQTTSVVYCRRLNTVPLRSLKPCCGSGSDDSRVASDRIVRPSPSSYTNLH